jgi:DNA-binding response OmpR family regulator
MVSNNKILVIDNDKDTCDLLQYLLGKDGFDVQCVHSLNEGLEEVFNNRPDIIIIDINLSDKLIFDALKAIKAIKRIHPQAQVISSSVFNGNNERGKSIDSGASYFIMKPFSGRLINSIVHQIAS